MTPPTQAAAAVLPFPTPPATSHPPPSTPPSDLLLPSPSLPRGRVKPAAFPPRGWNPSSRLWRLGWRCGTGFAPQDSPATSPTGRRIGEWDGAPCCSRRWGRARRRRTPVRLRFLDLQGRGRRINARLTSLGIQLPTATAASNPKQARMMTPPKMTRPRARARPL